MQLLTITKLSKIDSTPAADLPSGTRPAAVFQPGRGDQFSPRPNALIVVSCSTCDTNLFAGVFGVNPMSFFRLPGDSHRVEMTGLEPVTSWLQTTRSPS